MYAPGVMPVTALTSLAGYNLNWVNVPCTTTSIHEKEKSAMGGSLSLHQNHILAHTYSEVFVYWHIVGVGLAIRNNVEVHVGQTL